MDDLIQVIGLNTILDGRHIHHDIHLNIEKGKTTVILGRSGCGKSVLLKILMRILEPTTGKILFNGENIVEMSDKKLNAVRTQMSVVFQASALFDSMTVYENVGFFPMYYKLFPIPEIKRKAEELLNWVGLHDVGYLYPGQLSGGMKKRVGIARALINDPQLVLFDEPTTGLDPIMTDVFNQIINNLRHERNVTSLVVTHDMGSAYKIADYIYMMEQGAIIAEGTVEQIRYSDDARVQQFIQGNAGGPIKV